MWRVAPLLAPLLARRFTGGAAPASLPESGEAFRRSKSVPLGCFLATLVFPLACALAHPGRAFSRSREAAEGVGEIVWAGLNPAPETPLNVPIGPHRRFYGIGARARGSADRLSTAETDEVWEMDEAAARREDFRAASRIQQFMDGAGRAPPPHPYRRPASQCPRTG